MRTALSVMDITELRISFLRFLFVVERHGENGSEFRANHQLSRDIELHHVCLFTGAPVGAYGVSMFDKFPRT